MHLRNRAPVQKGWSSAFEEETIFVSGRGPVACRFWEASCRHAQAFPVTLLLLVWGHRPGALLTMTMTGIGCSRTPRQLRRLLLLLPLPGNIWV